jgi:hypothetical protein
MGKIILSLFALGAITAGATVGSTSVAAQAVLKAEGSISGASIVIQELKRDESNSVTLRFQMINDADAWFVNGRFREMGNAKASHDEVSGVHLIDNANKKKYLVVRDAAGHCACSTLKKVEKGAKVNLWAKFAAPPANVEKITVVVPDFQPIDGVPITR